MLLASTFILLTFASPVAAAKSYSADRFDVDIQVQPGRAALVKETVAFRFEGGPFTFAFRGLPTRYTDGLTGFQLMEGGRTPIERAVRDPGQCRAHQKE